MDIRTKTCPQCGKRFSYDVGQGKDRIICSLACRNARRLEQKQKRLADAPECSVDGCSKKQRGLLGLCEMHYARQRSTGSLDRAAPKLRYRTGAGYIKVLDREHPMSDGNGHAYEHRKVMFDQHGGECPGCGWCGVPLQWSSAVVDHLNEDKSDNTPSNLVVSCNDCNRARGAILPFVRKLSPAAFDLLIRAFRSQIK